MQKVFRSVIAVLFLSLLSDFLFCQHWALDPFNQKVFVENKGQFSLNLEKCKYEKSPVKYAVRTNGVEMYFTASGVTFKHDALVPLKDPIKKREQNSAFNKKSKEENEQLKQYRSEFLSVQWDGANPDPEIAGAELARNYFTYPDLKDGKGSSGLRANAYRKIIYKNIYPQIDVVYTFPENEEGFKYSLVLHPNADLHKVKMKYSGAKSFSFDAKGNLIVSSVFGDFVDHAPVLYDEAGKIIKSSFSLENNIVTFHSENYDSGKTIIVDPWTTIPVFSGSQKAYDIDWDFQGNVYIYGGMYPYQLIKLNSAGVIQWTYTSTFIGNPNCYGDFAVDRNTGTSFLCQASLSAPGADMRKVNTAGIQTATFPGDTRVNEMWRIAYNSCTKKGVIGCGNTVQLYQAATFDTNLTAITPVNVMSTAQSYVDMVFLAIDDTNAYMMTSENGSTSLANNLIKCPVATLAPTAYTINTGYQFQEAASVTYPGNYTNGFNGIAKDKNYLYTYDGATLKKWNPVNGSLLNSISVSSNTFLCGGLAVDGCGDIYLGSINGILKYSSNLVLISTFSTSGAVYDIAIGSSGDVFACGNGFVMAQNLNACPPAGNNVIVSSSSVSLCQGNNVTLSASGGNTYTWNTGATTPSIIVTPTVTTNYTVVGVGACMRDTSVITVNVGPPVFPAVSPSTTICSGNSLTLSASGGAGFVWSTGETTSSIVVTPQYTTNYSVTIANGACAATRSVTAGVSPTPVVSASSSPPSVCQGNSIQLNTLFQLGCGTHSSVCSGPVTTVQMGTLTTYTNTAGPTPFAGLTTSAKMQYLYLASELAAAGMNQPSTISQIGFNIQSLLGVNVYQNFTIKMGCTSTNTLTNTFENGLSVVYNPKNTQALVNGTNYFVFDNNYDWDGTSNLIIEICFTNSTASQNAYAYYSTTGFNSVTAFTGASVCNSVTGVAGMNRPTTYFRHCTSSTGSGFNYAWTPASTLNNSTIANPVATPTSTTTYTVTTTDPVSGCVSNTSATVFVGTPFTLSSSNDTTICQTTGIQIYTTPSIPGAYTYSWSPSSSLSNPNISNPVASPISTTTYVVTAQLNGCTATDVVKINVPYLYNFFVTPSADSICIGQSVPLSSILQNVCGVHSSTCASTYSAQVGSAATTSAADNITTFVGTYNSSRFQYLYRASELNASGITGASTITQIGLNVNAVTGNNVYQNFTVKMGCTGQNSVTATYVSGLQTVFNTKPLVISNGMNYLVLDNTYDWDGVSNVLIEICFSNAVTSPSSSIYYSATAFPSGIYYSANTSACNNPTGTAVSTRPNTYFKCCAGQGLSTLVYSWLPAATLSDDSIPNPVASPTTITTYTLVATDTLTGCIFSDSASITASPIFTTTSTDGVINCTTTGVQIHASASPAGPYSYAWSPSASLSNPNISNPMASPSVTTTYTVVVTSALGCSVSDTVTVSVIVPGLYNFSVFPHLDTICSGSSAILNALIQKGCGVNGSVCGGPVTATQIGTGVLASNTTGITPFAGSVNSTRYQYLYKASELIAAGMNTPTTISQIGFNIQSIVGSNSYQNFTIKMGCTSSASLTTTFAGSLPTVYNPKPTAIFNGMNYFPLDNFYDWDGVSNLIVEICFSNSVASQNSYVYYSASTYPCVLYSAGVGTCANVSGITGLNRPNTYFKHCGAAGGSNFNYLWSPSGTLNSSTNPNPVASPTTTTTYVLIASDTSSGCTMTDSSKVIVLGTSSALIDLGVDKTVCPGNNVTLNAGPGFASYLWNTGSSASSIIISTPGSYWVTGLNMCGSDRDTISINYYPVNSLSLGPDLSICAGGAATLTATATGFTSYLWSTGQSTSSITVNTSGAYWVSSSNSCGAASDTIKVLPLNFPSVSLGNDTVLCVGNNLTLNAGGGAYSYSWSTGATGSTIMPGAAGNYWVDVSNQCGVATDTIGINYYPANSLTLGSDVNICSGSSTTLTATTTGFANFLWSTGATTTSIIVNTAGNYWISSSNNCGSASDTVKVVVDLMPFVALGNDTIVCPGNTLTLNAGSGYTYQWNTGASGQTINVSSAGIYSVTVNNSCGVDSDTININFYPPNSLSLGNDTAICSGDSVQLHFTASGFTNFIWYNGQTTSSVSVNQPGNYWVSSSNICGAATDTIRVSVLALPTVSLGNDTAICTPTIISSAATNTSGYVWNSGATTSGIYVTQPGTYWVSVSNQCGSDKDTIVITLGVKPAFTLGQDTVLCSTTPVNINLSGAGTGFLWQDNSTLPTYTISSSGIYWVVVTNAAGCTNTDTLAVNFDSPPFIFAGNDTMICEGQEITLTPVSSGSYFWNNGTSNLPLVVNTDGVYTVYTSNSCGTVSDAVTVRTEKCSCNVDVPNAFSPNSDGVNDMFYVRGDCEDFVLRIYDRWGEKVFESKQLSNGWDGTFNGMKMNSGIFDYYLITRPDTEGQKIKKGNISLIR